MPSKIALCFAGVPLLITALAILSVLLGGAATPGAGIFQSLLDDCSENGTNCPELLFKFRAYQQIYIVDVDVARQWAPPEVELMSIAGKTLGALFVVEYDWVSYKEIPASPGREVDILLLAGQGPDGFMGAWATHVLMTDPELERMGRAEMGLPAVSCDVQVAHHCAKADQGITLHVGPEEDIDKVEACLPLGPGEGWMDLTSLVNHTLPNLTGKIPTNMTAKLNALPHQHLGKDGLTDLMMYLLTFYNADLKLASSVPQDVDDSRARLGSKVAPMLKDLLGGFVLPSAMVFDNVAATTWDTARLTDGGGWVVDPYHHLADGSHVDVPERLARSSSSDGALASKTEL